MTLVAGTARAKVTGRAGSAVPHRPVPRPIFRLLRAFAFDPSHGKNYGNYMTLKVPFEHPLAPGPVGRYVAIVDYDAANRCYYEPVDLNDRWILANSGLTPSESDPRFHQQMSYAVVSETIQRFEYALGRRIHWRDDKSRKSSPYHRKLLVFPHGIQEPNAFYDPEIHALVFGYFTASEKDPGNNLPGQIVFTCLAHDVIAHETTHALLDGVRPGYMEPTNIDVAAFHEGFADIVALFQHFSIKEAVLEALRGTRGTLFREVMEPEVRPGKEGGRIIGELSTNNPLVGLARQFGDAMELHGPLRRAIGTPANSNLLDTMTEPHDRGSILVAAIFDAFFTVFLRRTTDLWRIAGISRDEARDVDLHPDLLTRLADEVSKAAGHFETMCIRALDYCPPVDITFGDYLRATITADYECVNDDDLGYRSAIVDAFRSRGIRPEGVTSFSEESLLWCPPESNRELKLTGLRMTPPNSTDQQRAQIAQHNARLLHAFAVQNAETFGLSARNGRHIAVDSFHYVVRPSPDSELPMYEMVAVINERQAGKNSGSAPALGGVTLVFEEDGRVRFAIRKSLRTDRAAKQTAFRHDWWESSPRGAYEPFQPEKIDFRALHRRY
jgi:hypothetical protein